MSTTNTKCIEVLKWAIYKLNYWASSRIVAMQVTMWSVSKPPLLHKHYLSGMMMKMQCILTVWLRPFQCTRHKTCDIELRQWHLIRVNVLSVRGGHLSL